MSGRTVRGGTGMHCHHGNGRVIAHIIKGACSSAELSSSMLKVELAGSGGHGSVPSASLRTISSTLEKCCFGLEFHRDPLRAPCTLDVIHLRTNCASRQHQMLTPSS